MSEVLVAVQVVAFLTALFGGFACLLWGMWFGGPPEAALIGIAGLPAAVAIASLGGRP